MLITKQNIDESTAILKLQIGKADYEEKVNKVLEDHRKKAVIKGFRPGKVPASMINKMYKKPVLADEINKLIGESVNNYIKDEKIEIIGDPLPYDKEQKPINFDTDTDFEFSFELGMAPNFEANISDKDKIKYYQVKVEDKMVDNYIDSYTRRFGKYEECDVVESNEMIRAHVVKLDDAGNILSDGLKADNVPLALDRIEDVEIKKLFAGKKVNDVMVVDLKKAYPNEYDLSHMFGIKKEQVEEKVTGNFQLNIQSISKFQNATLDQTLFDNVFGAGIVNGEEEFRSKLIEDIKSNLAKESDYKFAIDAKDFYLTKLAFNLPKDFISRWLLFINEGKYTIDQIETEYPRFEKDLKWQMIKNKILRAADLKVTEEEVLEHAKELTKQQFKQYGYFNVPEENISNYATQMLQKEGEAKRIIDLIIDEKILVHIKANVKLDQKEITSEEFGKMFETK